MATTQLEHTTVSAGNRGLWTFSFWVKRGNLAVDQKIYSEYGSASDFFAMGFTGSDTLEFQNKDDGSNNLVYLTSRKFKDASAWYHIVAAYDSSQASASDRFRVWINGVAETNWGSSTLPAQDNTDLSISKGSSGTYPPRIGSYTSAYYEGWMAQVVKVDGQSLAASNFGSTDTTTGEWKPKSDGEVRTAVNAGSGFGTTGWLLNFSNASNLGYDYKTSDRSSNLDFTLSGDGFQSQTNPSNTFSTGEIASYQASGFTWYTGNTKMLNSTGAWETVWWNMAPTKGKWYLEAKLITIGGGAFMGIADVDEIAQEYNGDFSLGVGTYQYAVKTNGQKRNNDVDSAFGNSFTSGDIMSIAMDLDNQKIYFGKNGTWEDSGDPTSGATGTGSAFDLESGLPYSPAFSSLSSAHWAINTGEGWFGGTQISSANSDGAGLGQMEYSVPSGYYTMCTKNLKTYG